jgi:hypothetical protein
LSLRSPTNGWTAELDWRQICYPTRTFIPRLMASGTKAEALDVAAFVPSRWIVMIRRAIPAFVIFIALSQSATAGVPLFGHLSCGVVRFYVAKYSEAAAEKWARGHGAGDAEIQTARRCLHGANVQTASSAVRSQVPAPVTGQERAQHEPAERPDQDVPHVVPVQGQRADPDQDNHDNEPGVHGFNRPKDIVAEHADYLIKEPVLANGKTTTQRPRYSGSTHRANRGAVTGHVPWLKRLWDHLTRRRQFSIAFLHFRGGRR